MNRAVDVDAYIYQLHDPDLLPIGNKLKKMGKKVIFDSHEDVPEQIRDKQWIPRIIRNLVSSIYEAYEKRSIKKYDAVLSVTPHIIDRLKKINPNTVMITNYPIVDEYIEIIKKPERAICFAGGIKEEYRHHYILEAIEDIDNIKYILAGIGEEEYLKTLKTQPSWRKVKYLGKIPPWEVKQIYSQSLAGLAIHQSTQLEKEGSLGAIKIFEFMGAELPIICSNYVLWQEIVDEYKCGICVDPNSVEEIRNAINYILNNSEEAKIMGKNGRQAVIEKYNWGVQEKILLKLYDDLQIKL